MALPLSTPHSMFAATFVQIFIISVKSVMV
jgi:hypothetical protein